MHYWVLKRSQTFSFLRQSYANFYSRCGPSSDLGDPAWTNCNLLPLRYPHKLEKRFLEICLFSVKHCPTPQPPGGWGSSCSWSNLKGLLPILGQGTCSIPNFVQIYCTNSEKKPMFEFPCVILRKLKLTPLLGSEGLVYIVLISLLLDLQNWSLI